MNLKVLTPTKSVFDEEIDELIVDTPNGQIGVMKNHVPLITTVLPGEMSLKIKGKLQHYAITGGFLEVMHDSAMLLADYAIHSEEIELEKALEAKKRAEAILKRSKENLSERDFALAQGDLRKAISELRVAKRRRNPKLQI